MVNARGVSGGRIKIKEDRRGADARHGHLYRLNQNRVTMNVVNKKHNRKPAAADTESARQIKHRLRLAPKESARHPPKKTEVRLGV
jgi:hypothetical protein